MRTKLGLAALFLILAACVWFAADAARGSATSGEPSKPASANGQAESEAESAKPQDASSETTADGLRAAFVRGNALWIKNGSAERQLTETQEESKIRIRYPKWSSDGHSIAYTKELNNSRELHIIGADGRNDRVVGPADGYYEWSPAASRLAFVHDGQLSWLEAQSPDKFHSVAKEISNFSWLPDGSGFFASTQAKPTGEGGDLMNWTQIKLLRIPLSAAGDPGRFETVYTLPKPSDQLFAVGTSPFRWSSNGRWIAFLATPTASLSADGNALCIVSSDGRVFRQVDEMVNNPDWFEWAPQGETLAYIGGGGRMATDNKQLRIIAAPSSEPKSYTPQGKVDQGFAWDGPRRMIVSRAAESEWENEPAKRPYAALYAIDLTTGEQRPMTEAAKAAKPAAYGEYAPALLSRHRLAWISTDRVTADVILSRSNGERPSLWIRGIDLGDNYYEQWRWDAVLDFDKPSQADAKK